MINNDAIFVRRLAVDTVIGVHDWERKQTQTLFLSVTLSVNTQKAASTDAVADTVDYAAVADVIREHLQANNYQLIEALANQVCALLLEQFSAVSAVSLTVEKPDAVPGAESLGVRIHRNRN